MTFPDLRFVRILPLMTLATVLAACGDDPTAPEVEFQVIEETDFHPVLEIDLADYEKLSTGVYIQDQVVGTGAPLVLGDHAFLSYTGRLSTGAIFSSGPYDYTLGTQASIPGFEQGMVGMRAGGTRRIIIPPILGYGAAPQNGIPPGSILIFEITLNQIVPAS